MMIPDPEELAARNGHAWAGRDLDAIVAMHTDDTVFHLHDVAGPACGRAAVRDVIVGVFEEIPDLHFERRRVLFGADHFVSEYVMSGTADGKPFHCDGVDVFLRCETASSRAKTHTSTGWRTRGRSGWI